MPIVHVPERWKQSAVPCDTGRGLTIVGIDGGLPEGNYDVCIVYESLGRARCDYIRYAYNRRHAARLLEAISCFEKLVEEKGEIVRVFDSLGAKIKITGFLRGNVYRVDGHVYGPGYVVQIYPHMAVMLGGYAFNGLLYVEGPLNWTSATYFISPSAHFEPIYAVHRLKIIPFSTPKLYV